MTNPIDKPFAEVSYFGKVGIVTILVVGLVVVYIVKQLRRVHEVLRR